MTNVEWPPLAIGSAFAAALVTALWKAARLSGDANKEWSSRIGVVEAKLTERAVAAVSILRRKIDKVLGQPDAEFDRTTDPTVLTKPVRDFERCMSALRLARRHFRALLSLGSYAGASLFVLLVCDILGALHISRLWLMPARLVPWVIGAACVAGATGVGVVGAQWYLQRKLADAEILSERKDLADD